MSESIPQIDPGADSRALLSVDLPVDGIHCAGCVSKIESALRTVPGVMEASVSLATGEAHVSFDPDRASLDELMKAVEGAGYSVPVASTELSVEGMHCAACVSRVERLMRGGPGVLAADVSLATESAQIQFVPGLLDLESLGGRVEAGGFHLVTDPGEGLEETLARRDRDRAAEYRDLLRRFWVGVVLGGPVVIIGYAHLIPGLRGSIRGS